MQKIPEQRKTKKRKRKPSPPRYPAHIRHKISEGLKKPDSFFVQVTPTLRVEVLPVNHEEAWEYDWQRQPIEVPGLGLPYPGPLLLHFSRIGFVFAFASDKINYLGPGIMDPLGPHQHCKLPSHISYTQARGRVIAMHVTKRP